MTQPTMIDWICSRCGGINVDDFVCICRRPCDPVAHRRRHQDAVRRARRGETHRRSARAA